jgi:Fe-S-cluster containining protein
MDPLVQITRYSRSEFNDLISGMNAAHRSQLLKEQMPLADASPYRSTSVTERSRHAIPDCVTCGVCCSLPLVVSVPRGDEERLDEYWDITVEDVTVDRVIGRDLETGRCINLEGTLGEKIACRIYETRPNTCRIFDAGSDRCYEYRRMYGIDPQLTEEELKRDSRPIKRTQSGCISDCSIDLESEQVSMGFAENGEMVTTSTKLMRITVGLDRDKSEPHELYQYDASQEEWHENEFLGLTIEDANLLIAERGQTRGL